MSGEVVPDFDDGIPIVEDAEPEDAEIEHLVPVEELDLDDDEDET